MSNVKFFSIAPDQFQNNQVDFGITKSLDKETFIRVVKYQETLQYVRIFGYQDNGPKIEGFIALKSWKFNQERPIFIDKKPCHFLMD